MLILFQKPESKQTGMYYLRTKPAVNAIQYTVEKNEVQSTFANQLASTFDGDSCLSCSA